MTWFEGAGFGENLEISATAYATCPAVISRQNVSFSIKNNRAIYDGVGSHAAGTGQVAINMFQIVTSIPQSYFASMPTVRVYDARTNVTKVCTVGHSIII